MPAIKKSAGGNKAFSRVKACPEGGKKAQRREEAESRKKTFKDRLIYMAYIIRSRPFKCKGGAKGRFRAGLDRKIELLKAAAGKGHKQGVFKISACRAKKSPIFRSFRKKIRKTQKKPKN